MSDVIGSLNIVRNFMIGNTHVMIADDYCRDMAPEDVKKALRKIAQTAQANLTAAANRAGNG